MACLVTDILLGLKRPECEAISTAEVKNAWSLCLHSPIYINGAMS
jgi:hypothetical protein